MEHYDTSHEENFTQSHDEHRKKKPHHEEQKSLAISPTQKQRNIP